VGVDVGVLLVGEGKIQTFATWQVKRRGEVRTLRLTLLQSFLARVCQALWLAPLALKRLTGCITAVMCG